MSTSTAEEAVPTPKRRGRPPGSTIPAAERKEHLTLRLRADRKAKLRALGTDWLDAAIDRAKLPQS